jgi:hypothetical protein
MLAQRKSQSENSIMESGTQQLRQEYEEVLRTRKDINIAVQALRRAIAREDREFGADGLGARLDLIKDELLQ